MGLDDIKKFIREVRTYLSKNALMRFKILAVIITSGLLSGLNYFGYLKLKNINVGFNNDFQQGPNDFLGLCIMICFLAYIDFRYLIFLAQRKDKESAKD